MKKIKKRLIAGILASAMLFSFSACAKEEIPEDTLNYNTIAPTSDTKTKETTASTTTAEATTAEATTADTAGNGETIDITETTANTAETTETTKKAGVATTAPPETNPNKTETGTGTYEYEYFQYLERIAYYISFVEYQMEHDLNNPNHWAMGFHQTCVSEEAFRKPYRTVLEHAKLLLTSAGQPINEMTSVGLSEYYREHKKGYRYTSYEVTSVMGLSFGGVDLKLIQFAEILLGLEEKYPDYSGAYRLTANQKTALQGIIDGCKPVAETREEYFEKLRVYLEDVLQGLQVVSEYLEDVQTVKVTMTLLTGGQGFCFSSNFGHHEWIKDFNGKIEDAMTTTYGPQSSPMTLYIPLVDYWSIGGELGVQIVNNGIAGNEMKVQIPLSFPETEDEIVKASDPFLDAALRAAFDGDYTTGDLRTIYGLVVWNSYKTAEGEDTEPYIVLNFHDFTSETYFYCDFFDGKSNEKCAETIKDDIALFPMLKTFAVCEGKYCTLNHHQNSDLVSASEIYTAEELVKMGY